MKKRAALLSGALLLGMVPALFAPAPVSAASPSPFIVDVSNAYRPVTHVASGSLYGLAEEGRPANDLIAPTHPKMFTQMAPGGQQLPNGETKPVGDALKVAPIAKRNGAEVTIRMPDIYPDFPYKWVSWDDWYGKVDQIVKARLDSGADNIYGYEIWNEPDGTWDTNKAGSFNEGWEKTYLRIKQQDTTTKIIGPSITHYNEGWLKDFLTYARDHHVLPDIISWHELGAPEGYYVDGPAPQYISSHISAYRALEKQLGISPRLISINEYGVISEQAVPGNMTRYIAQFERSGVDTANIAFWFRPGRLSNLVTANGEKNGAWWLYKWYGDMSGQMVMTTPPNPQALDLDGIASVNDSKQQVDVVFGGGTGNHTIVIKGLNALSAFSGTASVKLESTPWYGVDTPVSEPTTVFTGNVAIQNGQITIPVTDMKSSSGYHVTITPASQSDITRYEAEKANVQGASVLSSSHASSSSYVGRIDHPDSYVEFTVSAPAAGNYNLTVGYANGGSSTSQQSLSVNGAEATTLNYPATRGWLDAADGAAVQQQIALKEGSNTIRLTKAGSGYAELDYIQLQQLGSFKQRVEAEDAKVQGARIVNSSFASNDRFVGNIDNNDSSVTFSVYAPAAGTYKMDVGYANGTNATSTHTLTINGQAQDAVSYPTTGGWTANVPNFGTRQIVTVSVNLKQGDNTIVLGKGNGYAELDYIEVY
ncbi:carbohydrate-binding protein [Paenibacillus hunanensis]|uniref:CBM35 domain-containing protein n=1 Tax=Paenibacillus hunanensis TaxID=539262 RepID=UPI0020275BB9|nr:CBM35 domain-containing protein [Paenibacillus hunanensis]MCL9662990.1 carbohydrate-binding protein [Paenibacillus hunanensis]